MDAPRGTNPLRFLITLAAVPLVAGSLCSLQGGVSPIERSLDDITAAKLKFVGYDTPSVKHIVGAQKALKITGYSHEPVITVEGGQLVISADDCGHEDTKDKDTKDKGKGKDEDEPNGARRDSGILGLLGAVAFYARSDAPLLTAAVLGSAAAAACGGVEAAGHAGHGCTPVIEVEIHTPFSTVQEEVMKLSLGGQFATCPAETLHWQHAPSVHGGYTGCVGEAGLTPCAQDGFEGTAGQEVLKKPFKFNEATGECDATGNDLSTTTLWILWGSPMDTHELTKRTGLNPVVSFPLLRQTYPSYSWGSHGDDSADFKVKMKEFLEYLGAFTASELSNFDVEVTEGAEAGVVQLWAAMALHIAKTTCNREIFALMEAPAYGYSNSRAAELANSHSGTFFDDTSCPCAQTVPNTCKDKTVTITSVGWVPGTDLPRRNASDGTPYAPDSSDPNSPWLESMVFPENPSGTLKTPRGPAARRICDGVYLYPMYFGGNGFRIPDSVPDCAAWSFSITKIYSAAVRAGAVIYKNTGSDWPDAVVTIVKKANQISDGIYSEWSWWGQMQIFDMFMAKPIDDNTSWVGAYSGLIKEKWEYVIEGFENCPVVEITNPYKGAYVWFKFKAPYLGLESSPNPSFFLEALGVKATSYYWGFRGADPADYYGAEYGVHDFTRMHLYRDVSVYKEVGRRAQEVCGGGRVPPYLSIADWNASRYSSRRLGAAAGPEAHARLLRDVNPSLEDREVKFLAALRQEAEAVGRSVEEHCKGEGYTTSCLFEHMGARAEDRPFP